jgi:hypothetical protein
MRRSGLNFLVMPRLSQSASITELSLSFASREARVRSDSQWPRLADAGVADSRRGDHRSSDAIAKWAAY